MRSTETTAAQTALVRQLAHDLREPLGPLALAVSALAEDPESGPTARELAAMAEAQVARMTRLLDAVVATARGVDVRISENVDLGEVVAEAAEAFRSAGGWCSLEIPTDCAVRADPQALRDAVVGLMESFGAGEVSVRVDRDGTGATVLLEGEQGPTGLLDGPPLASGRAALAHRARAIIEAHGGELSMADGRVVIRVRGEGQ